MPHRHVQSQTARHRNADQAASLPACTPYSLASLNAARIKRSWPLSGRWTSNVCESVFYLFVCFPFCLYHDIISSWYFCCQKLLNTGLHCYCPHLDICRTFNEAFFFSCHTKAMSSVKHCFHVIYFYFSVQYLYFFMYLSQDILTTLKLIMRNSFLQI